MKNILSAIALIVAVVALIITVAKPNALFLGNNNDSLDKIDGASKISTSTAAALPVLILERDNNRKYAKIVNNSDTAIYLTIADFDSATAASTTATLAGLYVGAGGSFEMKGGENLFINDVWASSTAASKIISAIYK